MRDMRSNAGIRGRLRDMQEEGNRKNRGNPPRGKAEAYGDVDELKEAVDVCIAIADRYERGISIEEAFHQAKTAGCARQEEKK